MDIGPTIQDVVAVTFLVAFAFGVLIGWIARRP